MERMKIECAKAEDRDRLVMFLGRNIYSKAAKITDSYAESKLDVMAIYIDPITGTKNYTQPARRIHAV